MGKSFRMLDEARRRRERGEDVVVGAIQPKASPEVDALLQRMLVIPQGNVGGVPTMDVEAILRRHPQVCLVDGLAYDNPPGSAHPKRWQDVEHLLSAGISVIATVNLQHIEERREQVERITHKHVDGDRAGELLTQCRRNRNRGRAAGLLLSNAVPIPSFVNGAGSTALSPQQLSELREIALLLAADVVDYQLEAYLVRHGIQQLWGTHERILVCVSPYVDAARMIASGRRNADRFHGDLFVAYIDRPDITPEERSVLERNLDEARAVDARIEALDGDDPADAIIQFARAHGITQIFMGNRMNLGWWDRIFGRPLDHLIRAAENIDVRVFPA